MTKKRLCLVLHLNQNVVPHTSIAASSCYRLLLDFLRRDPRRRLTLHVSGTLLVALNWLEPDILTNLRELAEAGQIELLGSTFAQNIPRVTPREDNDLQVELHRRWLFEIMNQRAVGFWNPERCWGESYVDLIARHGYDFTFLEDQIIESGGLSFDASLGSVATTRGRLLLVRDDRTLRHLVNATVWGNGWTELDRYLTSSPRRDFFFAEDGEAIGLWALEHGHDPRLHWHHLEQMVSRLDARGDVRLCTASEALAEMVPVPIQVPPDGQASWMIDALHQPGARFHEAGYTDWFDYARRSEGLQAQLARIEETRAITLDVLTKRANLSPIELQLQVAYCTHEYELGCIGVLHIGPGQFTKLRYAAVLATVRELLQDADPAPRWIGIEDRPDGPRLDTWITARDLIVLSPRGHIQHWFDRTTGRALCGNEVETSVWDSDDDLPAVEPTQQWIDGCRERIQLFQTGELENMLPAELRDRFQPAERRLTIRDRFDATHPIILLFQGTATPLLGLGSDVAMVMPPGASAMQRLPFLEGTRRVVAMTYTGTEVVDGALETRWHTERVSLQRRLATTPSGLAIRDTITRHDDDGELHYTVRHSFSPGYDVLLLRGIAGLTPIPGGVFNAEAAIGLQLQDYGRATLSCPGTGLLASLFDLTWTIAAGQAVPFVAEYSIGKLTTLP